MQNKKDDPGSLKAMKAGIIWREKLDYGKTIIGFLSIWIAAQFVLQAFHHPGFMLGLGILYAVVIGPQAGGNEVVDGAEEFSFSLSPARSLRYKVKYLYGLKPLLLLLSLGLVTIYFDLSQAFWSLFIESGLNNSYSIYGRAELFWYFISFFMPLTVYTIVFGIAIVAKSKKSVNNSVFLALVICGFLVGFMAVLDHYIGGLSSTILSVSVLVLTIILSLYFTYVTYRFKEGKSISRTEGGSRGGVMIFIFLILILFIILMLLFFKSNSIDHSGSSTNKVEMEKTSQPSKLIRSK